MTAQEMADRGIDKAVLLHPSLLVLAVSAFTMGYFLAGQGSALLALITP